MCNRAESASQIVGIWRWKNLPQRISSHFFSVTNSESIDFSSPKIQDIYLSRTGFFKEKNIRVFFLPGNIRFSDFQLAEKGLRISSHKGGWFHLASLLRLVGFFSVDIIPAFPIRGYRTIFVIRLRINTYLEAR